MPAAWLLASCLALVSARATDKDPAKVRNYPHTIFALPMVEGIRLDWDYGPTNLAGAEKEAAVEARFSTDRRGNPWFGLGKRRLLVGPKQHVRFRTMGPFSDFIYAEGREMIACDDKYLVAPHFSTTDPKQEDGDTVMELIALMKLDHGDCRLFEGGPDTLYLVLRDAQGRDEITSVESHPGSKPKIRKFLRVPGPPIVALAGDGEVTYYGRGKSIYEFKRGDKRPRLYYDASGEVRGLAYSRSTGLFYATPNRVGFVSPKFQMPFLTTPDPQLSLRGTDLYIRLNRTEDVLKLSGADRFKDLTWADDK